MCLVEHHNHEEMSLEIYFQISPFKLVPLDPVCGPTAEGSLPCGWARSLVSGRVSKGDRVLSSSSTLSSISVRADSRVSLSSSAPILY